MLETLFATVGKAFNLKGLVSLNTLLIFVLSAWAIGHEGDRIASAAAIQQNTNELLRMEKRAVERDEEIIRRLERIEDQINGLERHLIPTPE